MTKGDVTSRWQWVVLASSFLSLLITGFGQYQAGVMKLALIRHMDSDVILTTWLMSYYAGAFALTAPVGSALINVSSCRTCLTLSGVICLLGFLLSSFVTDITQLFFTITLIGIGQGMSNTGAIVILGYYFPDRASIATGVSISGGALGVFVHPPLLQFLVDSYGLRGAFLLSGAIAFQGSVLGSLMRPSRLELKATHNRPGGNMLQKLCGLCADVCRPQSSSSSASSSSPLMSWKMAANLLSVFLFSLAFHSLMVLLPYHLVHVGGVTATEASFAISVSGMGSFFSRLSAGFLAHDARIGHLVVYCGMQGVQVLVSLAAPSLIANGIVGSYAYCFMVGLYSGGVFSLMYPMLQLIVGLHQMATAFGMVLFMVGLGGLLGAPITELVQEQSSNPYVMFGFIGAVFCMSAVFSSLVSSISGPPVSTSDPHTPHTSHSRHDPPPEGTGDEEMQLCPMLSNTVQNQGSDPQKMLVVSKHGDQNYPPVMLVNDIENHSEPLHQNSVISKDSDWLVLHTTLDNDIENEMEHPQRSLVVSQSEKRNIPPVQSTSTSDTTQDKITSEKETPLRQGTHEVLTSEKETLLPGETQDAVTLEGEGLLSDQTQDMMTSKHERL